MNSLAFVLVLHLCWVGLSACVPSSQGRMVLRLAAIPPLVSTVVALGVLLGSSGDAPSLDVSWVPGLDLEFVFQIDSLAALMTLLVSGIGVLVFVYANGYFGPTAAGTGRFATTLLAFSTAMLGLVWADSVWTLFVFWEATSITSFLLVGHKSVDAAARLAARRALLITAGGGLALLAGLLILADRAGTTRLDDMGPVGGTAGGVAAALVLVAAATKSAQFPFHVWLPGAMAAPTPVSAYLHSATMVKAGVLLVALLGPALGETDVWKPVGIGFGLLSAFWGAIGALRHTDAKLILAWGTVSQLGLMIVLLSAGSGKAVFAAVSLILAHAVFKAALFMVVGEIDVRAGTRDISALSGLGSRMPLAAMVAVVSGASMAGVPPLLGFTAKEAAIEAALKMDGLEALVVGFAVIGGSVLTVAYTVRLLLGLFGPSDQPATDIADRRPAMAFPSALLAVGSVLGYVFLGTVNSLVRPAAVQVQPEAEVYYLLRWPGITTAFLISVAIVVAGSTVGWLVFRRPLGVPSPVGAGVVDRGTDGVLSVARFVTGRVQHGSLPVYMAVMAMTVIVAALPFAFDVEPSAIYLWDSPMQGVLAVVVVGAAVLTSGMASSRLGAALGLGSVGVAVSGLFVVHGAPDLALTQLLVETVIVVGFVLGLGHLTRRFPSAKAGWRLLRLVVSVCVGGAVALALASSASNPSGVPPLEDLTVAAVDEGGGNNLVNVILTDVRALDTLGEVVVLAVAALGILALTESGRSRKEEVA